MLIYYYYLYVLLLKKKGNYIFLYSNFFCFIFDMLLYDNTAKFFLFCGFFSYYIHSVFRSWWNNDSYSFRLCMPLIVDDFTVPECSIEIFYTLLWFSFYYYGPYFKSFAWENKRVCLNYDFFFFFSLLNIFYVSFIFTAAKHFFFVCDLRLYLLFFLNFRKFILFKK